MIFRISKTGGSHHGRFSSDRHHHHAAPAREPGPRAAGKRTGVPQSQAPRRARAPGALFGVRGSGDAEDRRRTGQGPLPRSDRRRAGAGLGVAVPHGGGFSQAPRRHGPHSEHREQADTGVVENARTQRGQPRGGRQGPGHLAGLWVCHRLRQGRHHRAARLRHPVLQPGVARAALLSGGAPGPGLRLLQGLLQPGHRQAARPGDPPARSRLWCARSSSSSGRIRSSSSSTVSGIRSPESSA